MAQLVVTPLTQALAEGKLTRDELRDFMIRINAPAFKRLFAWGVILCITSSLIYLSLGTLWLLPAMFVHGIVIVHHFSLQHECVHYSVFRTRWLNDLAGNICGWSIALPHKHFRYEHCDHHTYTQLNGDDPELIPIPNSIWGYLLYLSALPYWRTKFAEIGRHTLGRLSEEEKRFIPKVEHKSVFLEARAMVATYGAIVVAMLAFQWWIPLWFWILPAFLGEPVMRFIRMTEHVGRPQVYKMRDNTRTNLVSFPWRFLCWNMNYHAEHHYVPSVPFHTLPRLHEKMKPYIFVEPGGYLGAHRDIIAQVLGKKPRADGAEASGS